VTAKTGARRQLVTQIRRAGPDQTLGCFCILLQQSHGNDLSLIRGKLLQAQRLDRGKLAIDFDLGQLADREVQVADLVRDQQHAFDYGRQIKEAHAVRFLQTSCYATDRTKFAVEVRKSS